MKALALASVAIVAVLYGVLARYGPVWFADWAPSAVVYAAGVNLAVCWLSYVPVAWAQRSRPDWLMQALLGGTVIRMLGVAAGLLIGLLTGPWPTLVLSVCMLAFYLALLVVESVVTIGAIRVAMARQADRITRPPDAAGE